MKKIWILGLFSEYFEPLRSCGVVASVFNKLEMNFINIRDFATDKYNSVDDYPYGGGAGMVMRADILESALLKIPSDDKFVINLSPKGVVWNSKEIGKLYDILKHQDIVFICGRYEGIDQRFIEKYVDYEISLGDFIVSGGEVALLPILDSIFRFVPGVLGNDKSLVAETTSDLFSAPKYTRPRIWQGLEVPQVLLSGDHLKIEEFNKQEALKITRNKKS